MPLQQCLHVEPYTTSAFSLFSQLLVGMKIYNPAKSCKDPNPNPNPEGLLPVFYEG